MPKPFKGTVNVDIRDSEPDWEPFEPAKAPQGAPNVVYIVLDDVGFSAMSCYGGPIETPNIDRIAAAGVSYTQWHTTALCSPTRSCLLTGRNHTSNSMACITEAAIGFPNPSGTIPPENGMLSEILGERGWNTYMVGKWHLCPTDEMNLASTRRNWPSGRGFERWYGFLGAETNQWYPDLVYDNHMVDQPRSPDEGYHLTEDITDKALEFNGFATYIASGGDRDFMRPFAEELYGIPPDRVIGSALGLDYQASDDDTKLLYKSKIHFFDDGPEKPVRIWSRIGRRPLIACGNSNGDVPMLRFARVEGRPSLRLLILHDDKAREFDYTAGAEDALERARTKNWTIVSARNDWNTIFADPA